MASNIMEERMFYSFKEKAWHSLGQVSEVEQKAVEVLDEKFQGGFTTELRPVVVNLNGEQTETGDFAVVRSKTSDENSKEVVFGYCSKLYQTIQPKQICESFDENVKAPVETMAFLGEGNDMFISWKMPEIEIKKDDSIQLFGIVRTGFDTMKGTNLFTSTYRPVCNNTINLAQGWAKQNTDGKGRGEIWNSKHVNKNLLRNLGFWMSHVQENAKQEAGLIEDFFKVLAKTPVTSKEQTQDILKRAFPNMSELSNYYPKELKKDKQDSIVLFNEKQEAIRTGISNLFDGSGTAISMDLWGIMNATSEYFCNVLPSKKPISSSVMFGNRNKQILSVVNVLKELVV